MNTFLAALRWAAVLLLGTVFVLLFRNSEYKLARELNPVDIATALATLFLALYIPLRLERRLSSQRFELEVLIRAVEGIQAELVSIRTAVRSGAVSLSSHEETVLNNQFKDVSYRISALQELADLCKRDDISPALLDIEKQRRALKRLVTGGQFQLTPGFTYPAGVVLMADQLSAKLDLSLAKLIIKLNRH